MSTWLSSLQTSVKNERRYNSACNILLKDVKECEEKKAVRSGIVKGLTLKEWNGELGFYDNADETIKPYSKEVKSSSMKLEI